MLKSGSLTGKTIIITGGGTGLGKSMGKYFLELGANLGYYEQKSRMSFKILRHETDARKWRKSIGPGVRCPESTKK